MEKAGAAVWLQEVGARSTSSCTGNCAYKFETKHFSDSSGGFSAKMMDRCFVVLLFLESGEQQPKLRAASELWTDPESRINIGILPE